MAICNLYLPITRTSSTKMTVSLRYSKINQLREYARIVQIYIMVWLSTGKPIQHLHIFFLLQIFLLQMLHYNNFHRNYFKQYPTSSVLHKSV